MISAVDGMISAVKIMKNKANMEMFALTLGVGPRENNKTIGAVPDN